MNLGKAIKILLDQKGITQKELAEKIELSENSVSLIMNGKTQPKKDTLDKIAKVLKVKPEMLLILSISKDDVPQDRKQLYDLVWPQLEATLVNLFVK